MGKKERHKRTERYFRGRKVISHLISNRASAFRFGIDKSSRTIPMRQLMRRKCSPMVTKRSSRYKLQCVYNLPARNLRKGARGNKSFWDAASTYFSNLIIELWRFAALYGTMRTLHTFAVFIYLLYFSI